MKEYIKPEFDVILFQTEEICTMGGASDEYIEDPE